MPAGSPDGGPILVAEPAVALTDLALGIEAGVFAALLARDRRRSGRGLRSPMTTFFAATAVASLAGAALHGRSTQRTDPARRALWRTSLTAIGIAGWSSWWLGARLALGARAAIVVSRLAGLAHVPYAAIVLGSDAPFRVAIAAYVPGALFLSGALLGRLRSGRRRGPAGLALAAITVTFAAAGVQLGGVGLSRRFDHNALYHTLQAIGVAMFYGAARGLLAGESEDRRGRQSGTGCAIVPPRPGTGIFVRAGRTESATNKG